MLNVANTCAVQVLYWVNMASYKAIRPLCPAAAQARASNTGKDCHTVNLVFVSCRRTTLERHYHIFELIVTRM